MKIIFDNEKQKDRFFDAIVRSDWCPETSPYLGLHNHFNGTTDCESDDVYATCKKCWENSGIEIEVISVEKHANDNDLLTIQKLMNICRRALENGANQNSKVVTKFFGLNSDYVEDYYVGTEGTLYLTNYKVKEVKEDE